MSDTVTVISATALADEPSTNPHRRSSITFTKQLPTEGLFDEKKHYNEENCSTESQDRGPYMDDVQEISSFLETMHAKNMTLKKLAKKQQERIVQLQAENEVLQEENEHKEACLKEFQARVQRLQVELRLKRKTSLLQQGSGIHPDADDVDVGEGEQARTEENLHTVMAGQGGVLRQMGMMVRTAIMSSQRTIVGCMKNTVSQAGKSGFRKYGGMTHRLHAICLPVVTGALVGVVRGEAQCHVDRIE